MSVKRQPQIPLARAPREDVVGAVAAGAARDEREATPEQPPVAVERAQARAVPESAPRPSKPVKKRLVTFTNRLDPELLDWMMQYKDEEGVTIAAQLDEAVRDLKEKKTGKRPQS